MPIPPTNLVEREESTSSLVRFEDATDANTPRLNYSVPLPGAFSGKLYIETDYFNDAIPWTNASRTDLRKSVVINEFVSQVTLGRNPPVPQLSAIATISTVDSRPEQTPVLGIAVRAAAVGAGSAASTARVAAPQPTLTAGRSVVRTTSELDDLELVLGNKRIPFSNVIGPAASFRAPVITRSFGGTLDLDFVAEAETPEDANPRFVIIEHYRLSSFFGDYGAGRTVAVFSLMPGEETTLYIRNWRRSETTIKQASSIFDSFTTEAADEFETDLQAETTNTESESNLKKWHSSYSGSGEIGLGKLLRTRHSGQLVRDREQASARETVTKNIAKVTTKHASKASSKRETEVTQEFESTEEQENERITERKIRNTNLSRTLNVVARELNQEFTTYFSLVDVTVAFVNDLGVFDAFQVHEIDRMLERYIRDTPTGGLVQPTPFGAVSARSFVRARLIGEINSVYDFRGTRHDFLEEVVVDGATEMVFRPGEAPANAEDRYLRVRRSRTADGLNPFYEPGVVPVEGVVMNVNTNTVRTPAVVTDSLLGHGLALDNYALGLQQETLREKQLQNRRVEVALDLIAENDEARLASYRQTFGSVDADLLRQIALQ